MRTQLIAAGAATAVLMLTTGVAVAQGQHRSGVTAADLHAQVQATKGIHLTVIEHADTDTTTDTGARGDSVGDVLTFANPVFDESDTQQAGTDNGFCVRTKVGAAYECTWTTKLSGGSLTVSGPFYDARQSVLAVTGGSGTYAGAQGTMRLRARDAAGSAYTFAFHVRY